MDQLPDSTRPIVLCAAFSVQWGFITDISDEILVLPVKEVVLLVSYNYSLSYTLVALSGVIILPCSQSKWYILQYSFTITNRKDSQTPPVVENALSHLLDNNSPHYVM